VVAKEKKICPYPDYNPVYPGRWPVTLLTHKVVSRINRKHDDKIKEEEMDGACSMHGRGEKCVKL
jgi:hypothetical protein